MEPTAPYTSEDWLTIHSMLVSWLMNTIDPEVKSTISFYDDAKLLWDEMQARFSVVNGPRIQELKNDLAKCEQSKTMHVSTYFGKLKVLWDELANHEPIITCKCGKCECNLGKVHENRRNNERFHQFLMGLHSDYYSQLRTNLLSQEPLPSLDRAYQQITQEERIRGITRARESPQEVVGFSIRPEGRARAKSEKIDKSGLTCSHCHRSGHDIVTCFQLLGYPEWWGDRPRTQEVTHSRGKGGGGRMMNSTVGGRGRGAAVRAVAVEGCNNMVGDSVHGQKNSSNTTASTSNTPGSLPDLSADQWQKIAAMFGNSQPFTDRLHGEFSKTSWIIDTGASNHVTGNESHLFDIHDNVACPVGLPDGKKIVATKKGRVRLFENLYLKNVLYVPTLQCNLISVTQLIDDMHCCVQFASNMCVIQDRHTRKLIGTGERRDGLYYFRQPSTVKAISMDGSSSLLELWHQRLGHPSEKVLKFLPFLRNTSDILNKACDVCPRAKQSRNSFSLSDNKASRIFELVHCDLWGPYNTVSSSGARYFLTIVDDFSRAVWIYLLIDKLEVFKMFMTFFAMVDRQFGQKVKVVRSDNGTEFNCLTDYFLSNGILFQTSCVGTPQQNGRVERKHRHILTVARALRFQSHLPLYFWGECVLAASHLINRTPSHVLQNKTPYEILFNTLPNFDDLRVFGSLCYAHNQRAKTDKFASRSRKCVFVGYPFGKKGWRLFDLENKSFFVSRDVKFIENHFPFATNGDDAVGSKYNLGTMDLGDDDLDFNICWDPVSLSKELEPTTETSPLHVTNPNPTTTTLENATTFNPAVPNVDLDTVQPTSPPQRPSKGKATASAMDSATENHMGRGLREKVPSIRLRDYVTNTVITQSPSALSPVSPSPSVSSGAPFPITHYINCANFSVRHRNFLAAVTTGCEPKSFKEAMTDVGWRQAMQTEIRALEDNGTWSMEKLPPGKRALGSRWVYKIKYNSDGSIERLKARLVVFGNHQIIGIDYNETFAPVAKMVTIRTFLTIAASQNWELHQMDVHNAFLHGDLHEEVYMKFPPGFGSSQPDMVCRLRKSLYGLKQAPRCWFAKLVTALKEYGFIQFYADYSLFTFTKGAIQINVLVYVDDLIISGNNSAALRIFKNYLSTRFHMKDLGVLKYFLGIEVARSPTGIFLCQRKYALDIISETGLLGAKPVPFPIEQNHRLAHASGNLLSNPESYRRLVGRLIYLTVTRPDLAYSVHILSQFLQAPRQEHFEAAVRVVRYLKGSPGQGILLRADSSLSLTGWCDSDWAACPLTRRSLTGWIVFLGHSPISWKTKKQATVARSSAEAEYRSMASLTCELKWLKGLLLSFGIQHSAAIDLSCDSQSAIHIAQNPVFHERTKHIEADCHFVRDAIQDGTILPSYVPTTDQLADIFTKPLGTRQFQFLLSKLGVLNPHAPT